MLSPASLGTLGVSPQPASTTADTAPAAPVARTIPPLVPGSPMARALFQAWSGDSPVVIIDSPPGAGKTTAVSSMLAHFAKRSDLDVVAATTTRNQAIDLAKRTADLLPDDMVYLQLSKRPGEERPKRVVSGPRKDDARGVVVRTLASCLFKPPSCDLLVVDEAYQSTFGSLAVAAEYVTQLLMVGDPGQIGPVVTADTRVFTRMGMAPHLRAPDVLGDVDGATVFNFDTTWRLGPDTVEAIRPLYDFDFGSGRPQRSISGRDEINSVTVPPAGSVTDPVTMKRMVDEAAAYVGRDHYSVDDDGNATRYRLAEQDVAVVVSHNSQVTTVRAMLSSRDLTEVTVGTADRLQGGQWHAVVALDPLTGYDKVSRHALSAGRLCVMASRHATSLTWVTDGGWVDLLDDDDPGHAVQRHVRTSLTSHP